MDPKVEVLRHLLATVAYRTDKALRDAPPGFADYQLFGGVRTPAQILAHMGDLFDWTLSLLEGRGEWREAPPLVWDQEIRRFHQCLRRVDELLASGGAAQCPLERLVQGPVADALTHAGQLMMLRRMAGGPVRGENFFRADISVGQRY
jgi:hypothetical protein